ncbi:MAG TPA: hypothetical protein VHL11_02895 [Phototrophicaceae bacterium]|jgi:hypothetical protein|nr:hypothetical protein [Phototrophicaceae bacterium]
MPISYGPFLLPRLPLDFVETEEQCLTVLEKFARKGFCPWFREVIEGRVVEFQYDATTKTTAYHWLQGAAADAVLKIKQSCGGDAPYSYYYFLDGIGSVLIPGGTKKKAASLRLGKLSIDDYNFTAFPASRALAEIQTLNIRLVREAEASPDFAAASTHRPAINTLLEFHHSLLTDIERCVNAGIIFMMGN